MTLEKKLKQKFELTDIYKLSEYVLNECILTTAKMPKNFKYNFGSRINESALTLACGIAKVYMTKDINLKIKELQKLNDYSTELLILLRIANNNNLFVNRKSYTSCSDNIVSIMSQSKRWENSLNEKVQNEINSSDTSKV